MYDTACASYVWHKPDGDTTITTSGVYTKTFLVSHAHPNNSSSVAVCDSTVELNLTVYPTYQVTIDSARCYGPPIVFNEHSYSNPGHYIDTARYLTSSGCDSLIIFNLTIYPEVSDTIYDHVCEGEPYFSPLFGTIPASQTSLPHSVVINYQGCYERRVLLLTVNHPTTGIDEQTACDSFTWIDGQTYTESNYTATHTLTNAAGCDSVVTLHLTLTQTPTLTVCNDMVVEAGDTVQLSVSGANHYQWFPTEGLKRQANDMATLEVYSAGDPQSPDYESGIWVPIKGSLLP